MNLNTKFRRLLPIVFKLYIPILILLLLVLLVSYKTQIPVSTFTKDPAAIAGSHGLSPSVNVTTNPFVGVTSNIGILFWCITASVCFFGYLILRTNQNPELNKFKVFANFLRCFAIITSILLLDDLFLFHETIAPKLLKVPQVVVYFSYALIVVWAILKYNKIILQTEWDALLLAFLFFAISVTTDLVIDGFFEPLYSVEISESPLPVIIEDGAKLLGIASWCVYFSRVCFQTIKNFIKAQIIYKISSQKNSNISVF